MKNVLFLLQKLKGFDVQLLSNHQKAVFPLQELFHSPNVSKILKKLCKLQTFPVSSAWSDFSDSECWRLIGEINQLNLAELHV